MFSVWETFLVGALHGVGLCPVKTSRQAPRVLQLLARRLEVLSTNSCLLRGTWRFERDNVFYILRPISYKKDGITSALTRCARGLAMMMAPVSVVLQRHGNKPRKGSIASHKR